MSNLRVSTAVDCPICQKRIGRKADLNRHLKTHALNKAEFMHACTYPGCTYKTLQRSNLATHLNVHTRERPNKCPVDGCEFTTSDPGSLTRHRKEIHLYEPRGNSARQAARRATRQGRRVSPYARPSSSNSSSASGESVSPVEQGVFAYQSPRPRLPHIPIPILEDDPSSARRRERENKSGNAAYDTELVDPFSQVGASQSTPNSQPVDSPPPTSESQVTPEAESVEEVQLPAPELAPLGASELTHQPVAETFLDTEEVNTFLTQFDDWYQQTGYSRGFTSLPVPVEPYPIEYALPPSYGFRNRSSYEPAYTTNDAVYNPYGYPTMSAELYAQVLQSYALFAPYTQGILPPADPSTSYTTPTATYDYPQGLYLY